MSTYVIGDIQGCYDAFQALLAQVKFNPLIDKLWLVGDLVNRGKGSSAVLRYLMQLSLARPEAVVCVLGNHDLHAIAVAEGIATQKQGDTLHELLEADDSHQLLGWLRQQKMLHVEGEYVLVHAGLLPQWSVAQASELAHEVEDALRSGYYVEFLRHMYGNTPSIWHDDVQGYARLRLITNAMTRLRLCDADGHLDFKFKGELSDVPAGLTAWFDMPMRESSSHVILFGHWSALGLLVRDNLYALDTGCVWGGQLTALRLEDKAIFQVNSDVNDINSG